MDGAEEHQQSQSLVEEGATFVVLLSPAPHLPHPTSSARVRFPLVKRQDSHLQFAKMSGADTESTTTILWYMLWNK